MKSQNYTKTSEVNVTHNYILSNKIAPQFKRNDNAKICEGVKNCDYILFKKTISKSIA